MKTYGDVPFGSNNPTALFRRRPRGIILAWAIMVVTSLIIHLFMNGISGFAIQTFPVVGQVIDAKNGPSNGTVLPTDCANYLANAENWVTEFTNMTIFVRNSSYVDKYEAFVSGWNAGTTETNGPPSPDELSSCFVTPTVPQCSVTIRWFPLVVSAAAMLIKSVSAFIAIRKSRHFKYRLYNSLGDFIALAARHREELAVPGECLANRGEWKQAHAKALKGAEGVPRRASNRVQFWAQHLGKLDWVLWSFWIGGVIALGYVTQIAVTQVQAKFKTADSQTITNLFDLFTIAGFGKPSLAFIIGQSTGEGTSFGGKELAGFPLQIALANAPQVLFSISYLFWNNLVNRIWGEHEWRSFENRRKLPRVSYGATAPGTRDTRWLQLPYGLVMLLIGTSTLMHWVVSQTLFVVEVENQSGLPMINNAPAPPSLTYVVSYSPTAIFVSTCLSSLLIFCVTVYYFFPFRSHMPVMAGSARVVFASCTALPKDLPVDGVMWGDVSDEWGRLAGFGEHARSIKDGEIYPMRYNRQLSIGLLGNRTSSRGDVSLSARESLRSRAPTYFSRRFSNDGILGLEKVGPMPREGELQYPEDSSTYTPPQYFTHLTAEPSPVQFSSTSVRPQSSSTMATQAHGRLISFSSQRPPTPLLKRHQDQADFGSGYSTMREIEKIEPRSSQDSDDEEPKWQGWGVNPQINQRQNPESGDDKEVEWKGWGVNPD
jgi:hypothetical protein